MPLNIIFLFVSLIFSSPLLYAQQFDLSKIKPQIENYHNSGQYNQDISKIANQAAQYIHKRAKHPAANEKLAIVLDIDETTLSNYDAIIHDRFLTDDSRFRHLLKANDPAIQPMLKLYEAAQKDGISIFFVTGRRDGLCESTQKNLTKAGYENWAHIYCRPQTDTEESIVPFKRSIREKITREGYQIIANIGDQQSDLTGGYAEKTYKLPNPFYYLP